MNAIRCLALLSAFAGAVPAYAHDVWVAPAAVIVDEAVWVNPGVYVSQFSAVRRNYPYVGCCLPPYENWSLGRPYFAGAGIPARHAARVHFSQRRAIAEPPRDADRLHYPDGKPIERFR